MAVSDYSTTPDENISISGINIAEGCPPSNVNNAIRQLMADVKEESEGSLQADGSVSATAAIPFTSAGTIIQMGYDNQFARILGSTATKSGAELVLYGNEYTSGSNGGAFNLRSCNSSGTFYALRGDSTGTLTWRGNELATTSDVATEATRAKAAEAACLPLSGGTMTGRLTESSSTPMINLEDTKSTRGSIAKSTNTGFFTIRDVYSTTLASIGYATDSSAVGYLSIRAYANSTSESSKILALSSSGDITWGGNTVYTASSSDYIVEERTEQGTYYIRYASGVQLCHGHFNIAASDTVADQTAKVTFGATFRDALASVTITAAGVGTTDWGYFNGITVSAVATNNFTYRAYLGKHTDVIKAYYVAMGRWK